jgi:hypothetical protein
MIIVLIMHDCFLFKKQSVAYMRRDPQLNLSCMRHCCCFWYVNGNQLMHHDGTAEIFLWLNQWKLSLRDNDKPLRQIMTGIEHLEDLLAVPGCLAAICTDVNHMLLKSDQLWQLRWAPPTAWVSLVCLFSFCHAELLKSQRKGPWPAALCASLSAWGVSMVKGLVPLAMALQN